MVDLIGFKSSKGLEHRPAFKGIKTFLLGFTQVDIRLEHRPALKGIKTWEEHPGVAATRLEHRSALKTDTKKPLPLLVSGFLFAADT